MAPRDGAVKAAWGAFPCPGPEPARCARATQPANGHCLRCDPGNATWPGTGATHPVTSLERQVSTRRGCGTTTYQGLNTEPPIWGKVSSALHRQVARPLLPRTSRTYGQIAPVTAPAVFYPENTTLLQSPRRYLRLDSAGTAAYTHTSTNLLPSISSHLVVPTRPAPRTTPGASQLRLSNITAGPIYANHTHTKNE